MSRGAATILCVEDDGNDVLLIRRAFRKAALAADLAVVGDGDAAVEYLAGADGFADRTVHPFPMLVLLDLKLPRRSGHEVLGWLRRQPGIGRVPVAVLTSSRQDADVNRAYDLGANSYLVKPVAFADLLDMLRMLGMYWLVHNQGPDTT